ncbi:hypothetical protein ACFQ0B_14450 [Nonomuraea thailandensis]
MEVGPHLLPDARIADLEQVGHALGEPGRADEDQLALPLAQQALLHEQEDDVEEVVGVEMGDEAEVDRGQVDPRAAHRLDGAVRCVDEEPVVQQRGGAHAVVEDGSGADEVNPHFQPL